MCLHSIDVLPFLTAALQTGCISTEEMGDNQPATLGQLHCQMRSGVPLLIMFVLILAGCGPSQETLQPASKSGKPKEMKAPLAAYEETLNPALYDEDVDIVKKSHAEQKERMELEIKPDSTGVEEEIVQGFRIQVFASPSIDEAASMKNSVEIMVDDSVYVVYDPPVYKVRIGNYLTRLDANKMLSFLLERGFPDAWVVADRVTQRKVMRISR